jgi:hypothetical protein
MAIDVDHVRLTTLAQIEQFGPADTTIVPVTGRAERCTFVRGALDGWPARGASAPSGGLTGMGDHIVTCTSP